ncbi:putative peptide transporter PTR5-like [Capsicum annuum]|nr:putative peptide transporter PTR5-like [Capsicum annuum]
MPEKFRELPSSNMASNRSDCSSKERLKWTQELHDLFEKAVSQLGGPEIGKSERKSISEILPNFSATAGAQLNEALQMHMDAHKRLNDHLEIQRNLKIKLEAQGRFLDRIMEEQKARASGSRPSLKSYSYSPLSLPSLCEESESNIKELEVGYDTEIDRFCCQARKRTRFEDDAALLNRRYNSTNLTYSPYEELQSSTLATYESPLLQYALCDSLL